jgi:soluble lytic murein transglycosylase-like protein
MNTTGKITSSALLTGAIVLGSQLPTTASRFTAPKKIETMVANAPEIKNTKEKENQAIPEVKVDYSAEKVPEAFKGFQDEVTYFSIIETAAKTNNIPNHILKGLVATESGYNPNAVSSAKAKGLTQLMPFTATELNVTDPFNPEQNVDAGARYLKRMYNIFKKEKGDERWRFALGAYNAGAGNIIKAQKYIESRNGIVELPTSTGEKRKFRLSSDKWAHICYVLPAITGKHAGETTNYVRRTMAHTRHYAR